MIEYSRAFCLPLLAEPVTTKRFPEKDYDTDRIGYENTLKVRNPHNKQKRAAETILEQAALICNTRTGS